MDAWLDGFSWLQQALFEAVVQPIAFAAGQGHLLEKAYEGTGWLVVGLLQIAVMLVVIAPLQKRWPVEPVSDARAGRLWHAAVLPSRPLLPFRAWRRSGCAPII